MSKKILLALFYLTINLSTSAVMIDEKDILKELTNLKFLSKGIVPEAFDWRSSGAVAPIKDQGASCSTCSFIFAVVSNIESKNAIVNGDLISFSEQQVKDCQKVVDVYSALNYSVAKGLETESNYPYKKKLIDECKFDSKKVAVSVESYEHLDSDEVKIMEHIALKGPVIAEVPSLAMKLIMKGSILDIPLSQCGPITPDYAINIIGYGTKNNKDYWLIRNSVGESWGDNGYGMIARGKSFCNFNQKVFTTSPHNTG